jgi:hypothetical protein
VKEDEKPKKPAKQAEAAHEHFWNSSMKVSQQKGGTSF